MKKIALMLAVVLLCGCQSVDLQTEQSGGKEITFNVSHNYETRAELKGDGNILTDLWIFDFMAGEMVQQIHQVSTDADFAEPTMTLAYGEHHIYFVASRGTEPVVNTESKTIVFSSVRDTFWKDYYINVESTTSSDRSVMLDRVVTRLRVVFDDEVSATMATMGVQLSNWYQGINYTTGEPKNATTKTYSVEVPSSFIGTSGQLTASYYGFSGADEWTTNITITANSATDVIGTVTKENVPFKRNRITELHGNIFGSSGGMTIGVNDAWDTSYTDTW